MRKEGVKAMLESDAGKKRCPYKMMNHQGYSRGETIAPDINCDGVDCMGWDEWKKPDEDAGFGAYIPCDPPEGNCGMKPEAEIYCQH